MICIHFIFHRKAQSMEFCNFGMHLLLTLDTTKLTLCPRFKLIFWFTSNKMTWIKYPFSIVMITKIGKYMEHWLNISFMRQRHMIWHHWDFEIYVKSSKLNSPPYDINQGLVGGCFFRMYIRSWIQFRWTHACYWVIIVSRGIPALIINYIILYVLNCSIHILRVSKSPFFNTILKLHFYNRTTQVYLWGLNIFFFYIVVTDNTIPYCSFRILTYHRGIIVV